MWWLVLGCVGAEVDSAAPWVDPGVEGCGADVTGGQGGEVVAVTSLDDAGPGTLREALTERTFSGGAVVPREVVFEVSGTVTVASPIEVVTGSLTVDGSTAPSPGVTLEKAQVEGLIVELAASDVVLSHLRFVGTWEPGEAGVEGAGTLAVTGGRDSDGVSGVVLDHLTVRDANDAAADIWGTVSDVTLSWSLFLDNRHPVSVSHHPEPFLTRDCISIHHNVWTRTGERNPQLRGDVRRADLVENVVHGWGRTEEGRGSGVKIRAEAGEPSVEVNLVGNVFLPTERPEHALVYGDEPGPEDDGTPAVWLDDNVLPAEVVDAYATLDAPVEVPAVTRYGASALGDAVLPHVGMGWRDDEETAALRDVLLGGGW